MRSSRLTALVLCASTLAACKLHGVEPATPQRPTLSSDTSTTAQGTFELETGVDWDESDLLLTPTTFKYGVDERTEGYVSISPFSRVSALGDTDVGVGDLFLGGRHRFWENQSGTSSAVQMSVKLPTASRSKGLGSGDIDLLAAGIVTQKLGSASLTGYYELGVLDVGFGDSEFAHALAFAGSQPVTAKASLFGEVASVFSLPSAPDVWFTTLGAAYAVSPSVVFDAGVRVGLENLDGVAFVVGLTANLGRLWQGAPQSAPQSAPAQPGS